MTASDGSFDGEYGKSSNLVNTILNRFNKLV